ncbi:unnamed protein product [Leptidea sinapis]|uniref:Uncharacterized protein n=1 Tax=Leptidea sinapis TaxID=189913 RepID=A0A5E4Q1B1_9NEOP|nr:unnamed protein product [Leptidea sinapis]
MHYFIIYILIAHFIVIHELISDVQHLRQRERVSLLKKQIKNELKGKIFTIDDSDENYDFVTDKNYKITPINTLPRTVFPTGETQVVTDAETKDNTLRNSSKKYRLKKRKRINVKKSKVSKNISLPVPLETFYRRNFDAMLNTQAKWPHCQTLVTPILKGFKKVEEPVLELLSIDTTSFSKEDIYSVLYQLSVQKIRLFQWDVTPIKMLLNVIIKDKVHTFKSLRHGLRVMFNDYWKMDLSNATNMFYKVEKDNSVSQKDKSNVPVSR